MVEVYRDALGRNDLVPGLIAGVQTFNELVPLQVIGALALDRGRNVFRSTWDITNTIRRFSAWRNGLRFNLYGWHLWHLYMGGTYGTYRISSAGGIDQTTQNAHDTALELVGNWNSSKPHSPNLSLNLPLLRRWGIDKVKDYVKD